MSSSSYTPKYGVSPGELPLTDPSRFADRPEIVLDSIESAEDQLEWDVNSGEEIQTPEGIHAKAVREYATYDLKLPAASPGSRREGDVADDGQRRLAVAKEYRSRYEDTIQMILDVDKGEDADPESYAVPFGFESY